MSDVLIVDDEEPIAWGLARLARQEGHSAHTASCAEEALEITSRQPFDLIFLDVRLPGADGLSIMPQLAACPQPGKIVVMTAFGDLQTAVTSYDRGAFDYLVKPFGLDAAAQIMRRALVPPPQPATPAVAPAAGTLLVGNSGPMQEVFKRIALVAPTDAAVVITGESGTGKELVARAIHRHSPRSQAPFVAIHLAALSPTIIESELFGHRRGAYTGAEYSKSGLLEIATGGTVFLDEIGEVPPDVQVKLLRAIEQQEVTPVGSTQSQPTDFRMVAATNRDLQQEMIAGRFREDLYFRLAMFDIELPPLRQRKADIPILAEHFLDEVRSTGRTLSISAAAAQALFDYPWPGNVRQLRNVVHSAALLARDAQIDASHLSLPATNPLAAKASLSRTIQEWTRDRLAGNGPNANIYDEFLHLVERPFLEIVMEQTGQNRAAAAELLGIHRATLRKKLS